MARVTRRKFLAFAVSAAAAVSLPGAARALMAASSMTRLPYGGPTPNTDFYITSYSSTPRIDAAAWQLKFNGLVAHPLLLSYDELKKQPTIREMLTYECISNTPDGSAISSAIFTGTRLKSLFERVGIRGNAVYAAMHAADGYYTGVPIDEILHPDTFLLYEMNGVPLPPIHGYPARIFIPGKYGMKQPKWITEISFVDQKFTGYWETRGWSDEAWREVNSGFFHPRPNWSVFSFFAPPSGKLPPGPNELWGWAFARRGIKRVQVSTGDGAGWHDADLVENVSPDAWTVWKYPFTAKRGSYQMRVRATDASGQIQPPISTQTGSGMDGQAHLMVNVA
ncbi:MAG: molybdopterin-dependent oxidoreductase [Candidatus Binataceae bacterium]